MLRKSVVSLALSLGLGITFGASVFGQSIPEGSNPSATASSSPFSVDSGTSVLNIGQLSSANALQVAPGATAIIDFAGGGSLTFSGNISNSGNIFAISSNPNYSTATFNALNIFNNQGAVFSSVLPSSYTGFGSIVSNLNLSLNATNQIMNAGTISSAGNLSMSAASIINTGAINAAQNLNIVSQLGSIVNSGVISANAGNLNMSSLAAQNLVINNINGVLQSLLGNANFSTAATSSTLEKLNINLNGGNIIARELNFNALNGIVDVNTNTLEGIVNVNSCGAHITASTPVMNLGQMNITGDPTFYNTGGSINITSDLNFAPVQFVSAPVGLAIIAQGDVTASNGVSTISTAAYQNVTANWPGTPYTGNILIIAGAQFTATPTDNSSATASGAGDTTNLLTISGASAGGGSVNLAGVTIDSRAGIPSSSARSGDVTVLAYAGAPNTGNITLGTILTGQQNLITNDVGGVNGNVTVVGQGNVSVGTINTSGNFLNPVLYSGNVMVASAGIDMLQLPSPSNAWLPTLTTLTAPTVMGGVVNTAALPGQTVLTVSSTAGLLANQVLVLDPQGPNYEQVTISSVGTGQITLTTGVKNSHSASEAVYIRPTQAGLTTIVNAGAGAPPTIPLINNGQIFAPNLNSLSNGAVTIGTITGTGAVTVATNGSAQINNGVSLTLNPSTATPNPLNFFRLPVVNVTANSVSVNTGATLTSGVSGCSYCPNTTNIFTSSLTNLGTIGSSSGSNMMINVQSSGALNVNSTGTFVVPGGSVIELAAADKNALSVTGGTFSTGPTSVVIMNGQGSGGSVSLNGAISVTGNPVVSINTPNLTLSALGSLNGTGGAFLFSSGYTANPLTVNVPGTYTLVGAPATFTPFAGQNLVFTGNGLLHGARPVLFQLANGGSLQNPTVSYSGITVYQSNNPSGNIQGFEFQPYIGGRISNSNSNFVQFAAYPYQEVIALIANAMATIDSNTGVATPQFQYVSGYTQVSSTAYVIPAAKQLGLRASAGVFADINGDGSMTQSAYNTAIYDTQAAVTAASLYGNVVDIVVGNEDIVGNNGPDASASMSTLKNLITGGTVLIQFVGNSTVTGAQPTRNAAVNPLTGTNFTSTTLPVVTRQQNGVLNLVTDPNPNNANGMIALMNTLDGYVYGNYYPFFDQSNVVPTLLSNPGISQGAFTTLVQTYMTDQFNTNAANFKTAGVTTTKIRVGETGWATPMTSASSNPLIGYQGVGLPQQNMTWAQWYYPAMQNWSSTYANPQTGTNGAIISTYFASYDEPWKGIIGKSPNGTAVTVNNPSVTPPTPAVNPGSTTLPVSTGAIFYTPTLTPMSIVINPNGPTMEVQNYFNPNPGTNNLPISSTNFPGAIVNAHQNGESVVAGTPQEPFFGLFTATGSNLSTGSIYQLTGTSQKFNVAPMSMSTIFTPSPPPPVAAAGPTLSNPVAPGPLVVPGLTSFLASANNINNTTIIPTDVNPEIVPGSQADTGDVGVASASPGTGTLANSFSRFNNNILPNPQGNSVSLPSGNAFFLPDHDIVVDTPHAKINIAEGAAVMIFQSEAGMSVFNLFDNKAGDVAIQVGDETQELGVGRQLSITSKQGTELKDIAPDTVALRNVNAGKLKSKDTFASEFSHASALSNFAGLRKMLRSEDPEDKKKAERILKTAAALSLINKNSESFKPNQ
ncbi:MAG: hypothetical protein K2X77_05475 [Candidatus Obscuribacterales bacterium]|nr:hypothetical protein [Candidatus Obscuribacterales bacterium]